MSGTLSLAINAVNAIGASVIENKSVDTATVSRPGTSLGDYGTATPSYSTVVSNAPCSWQPSGKNTREYVRALKLTGVAVYEVEFAIGVDVRPQDRVTIAARGEESAHTLEVKGAPIINPGVSLTVLCTLES